MNWATVARYDFRLTRGSLLVQILGWLLLLVIGFGGYLYPVLEGSVTGGEPVSTVAFAGYIDAAIAFVLPLVALLMGYNAIVDERAGGQLPLVLSLPLDRRDVLVGKLVSRGIVPFGATLVALAAAWVLVVYPYGELEVLGYLGFVALTLVFGVVFLGLAVAISLASPSRHVAGVVAVGAFFVFIVAWDGAWTGIEVAWGAVGADSVPDWLLWGYAIEPSVLYQSVVTSALEGAEPTMLGREPPRGFSAPLATGLLLLWAVVPLALSYRHFARVDL